MWNILIDFFLMLRELNNIFLLNLDMSGEITAETVYVLLQMLFLYNRIRKTNPSLDEWAH